MDEQDTQRLTDEEKDYIRSSAEKIMAKWKNRDPAGYLLGIFPHNMADPEEFATNFIRNIDGHGAANRFRAFKLHIEAMPGSKVYRTAKESFDATKTGKGRKRKGTKKRRRHRKLRVL